MASSSSSTQVVQSTSTKLRLNSSSDEYNSWKAAMLYILESTYLIGYITGELPPPPETNTQAHKDWKRDDQTIKTWIVDSLSDELCPAVIAFKTARDVWQQLENIFTPPAPPPPLLHQGEVEHGNSNNKRMPLALYKAALRGDWDATKAILEQDPDLAEATVSPNIDTVLHIAVGTGQAIPYLQNLVDYMSDDSLELKNIRGYTALCMAAQMGNLPASTIMVERRPDLLYVPDNLGIYPVAKAAMSGNRATIEFFISRTKDDFDHHSPFAHDNGILLLINLIDTDFFEIAMDLIDKYPDLAERKHTTSGRSVLRSIAMKPAAFESGARFNYWERLIYSKFGRWHRHVRNLHTSLCKVLMKLVPRAKWIHDQKMKHDQAVKLVECLCERLEFINEDEAASIYAGPIIRAAELGIHEVLEVIVDKFPVAIYSAEPFTQRYLFHIAVENRCEKVFNLIYQMSDHKYRFSNLVDLSGSSMLHMVARLAPPHKLNLVSGAALQMQRELQWFKEVEKFLEPYDREHPNFEGKTPQMIFTEEHSNLKVEGEKWMKDTANSCSIAAALIATVVFAAAITVPGGNADSGYPLFVKSSAFIIFAVSDAISLFTSSTSLLMFLSILTSRYAEEDFLYALPKRLCVGLFTLFLSILFMTAAFSATIFLVFAKKSVWVLIPVAALARMPVASFVLLQFPLLVDVVSSTYGRGIFGRQSDRPFH